MSDSAYLMGNEHPETAARFEGLERSLDAVSVSHLSRLGVGAGARCLEVGAGGGSIARWLASRVGPHGQVVAVDLDTRWFHHDGSPPLEVRQLDLVAEPLPAGPVRLLPQRPLLQPTPPPLDGLRQVVGGRGAGGRVVL